MKRALRNAVKWCMGRAFAAGQWLGFDLLPRHFYSEIPDLRKLRRTTLWRKPYSMLGVAGADPDGQLEFARSVVTDPVRSRIARGDVHSTACAHNGEPGYGPVEADFLFAYVATQRPRNIVQVGCGVSTAVCLAAAAESDYSPAIICIEPYPNAFLTSAAAGGDVSLVPKPVEDLAPEFITDLGPGDLLFVDSSHTLGPAGEVTRIVLELLPRLRAGVRVHFHDIWFPYDFSADILRGDLFYWHESALLHAYLAFNGRTRILVSMSMLHHLRREALRELLPTYRPREEANGLTVTPGHYPSSIYLEVTS